MTEPKATKPDNPLISILINVIIPVAILSLLSDKEKSFGPIPGLGPVWALVVGLAFPITFGLHTFIKNRKADFMAILGVISVTLTGVFGILQLPAEYVAIKEAAIPLIIGIVIIASLKTPFPLIKKIMMTEALFDVKRLTTALKEKGTEATFEKRLVGLTWGFAASMFLSSILNYALAKIVLKSDPVTQAEAYTAELGKMTGYGYVVVLIPVMIVMFFVMNKLFNTLTELTGCKLDDLLAAHHREKAKENPPAEEVDPV